MPPIGTSFATIVHLQTGHVLAAVTSGSLEPTLADLTADEHLRVTLPGTAEFVDVPIALLAATRLAVGPDVLDRAQNYVVDVKSPTPITPSADPLLNAAEPLAPEETEAIVVWQDDDGPVAASGPLGIGNALYATAPPGAKTRLLAITGRPLHLMDSP
jgi:hypothetical protein